MTASAPAHGDHAVRVDQALPDQHIDAGHDVPRHLPEISVEDASEERIAVAGAAPVVRSEYEPASAGEDGEVVEEQPGSCAELVGFGRSAMHLNDERIASALDVAGRIEQQALDRR